ncbi:hypothetical protein WJT74_02380 [Sphingomicrobium sp. XHP0239]|uniref:hypothetical protein n=1 Tax=Sphingomicrobium maritimum TaxID=3133972 RepID=UPI0031CC5878
MTFGLRLAGLSACLIAAPGTALAQDDQDGPDHAVGASVIYSTDADETTVVRIGLNIDALYTSPDDYVGVRVERADYRPEGLDGDTDERFYLRVAKPIGDWQFRAEAGTDGRTAIGAIAVHNRDPVRVEAFVERDRLETPLGIALERYTTFGGAAIDLPFNEEQTTQVTLLAGLQDFEDENLRHHLRANFIQVVKSDWGLSAQLRTRYFGNSEPRALDYYSPEWFVEAIPVLQMRRFSAGWQYLAAAGWGAQRDSDSDWRSARLLNLRMISPQYGEGWSVTGDLVYSNQPITDSETYDYLRISSGVTRAF